MSNEDKALELLQSITKEIVGTLSTIKERRPHLSPNDSATNNKLTEILGQLKQVKAYIIKFIQERSVQTTLFD
tara:strand:+ start:376 stop:594 length:219 start_codon:yes stop_codon:yes gene_type:complete